VDRWEIAERRYAESRLDQSREDVEKISDDAICLAFATPRKVVDGICTRIATSRLAGGLAAGTLNIVAYKRDLKQVATPTAGTVAGRLDRAGGVRYFSAHERINMTE